MGFLGWDTPRDPQEIFMDQGTNFISGVLKGVCETLKVKQLHTSVYHLQIDGLIELFNCTLKGMNRTYIQGDPRKWELVIPPNSLQSKRCPKPPWDASNLSWCMGTSLGGS